jgi:hypothetical protein
MVHHQNVTVELSTCLLAAQREIETLRIQLWNSDATIRGYMRMVDGQPPPRSNDQSRNPQWTITLHPDLVLTRSHLSCVKSR